MKIGIRTRIAVALTVLISLFSAAITSFFLMQFDSYRDDMSATVHATSSDVLLDQAKTHNEKLAHLIADQLVNPLYFNELEAISKFTVATLQQEDIEYIYVFDAKGYIIHDGTETVMAFGHVVDDEGFKNVLKDGNDYSKVQSATLHTTVPITIGDKLLGGVQIGLSLANIDGFISQTQDTLSALHEERNEQLIQSTVLAIAFATVLGVLLSFAAFWGVARTIEALSSTMRQIGERDYNVRFLAPMLKRNDELGDLCVAVENMSQSLANNEEKLRTALDASQSANKAKNKFLSSMSHELRTPLNAVVGFAQVLESNGGSLDERNRRAVQQILKGGEHLLVLINELLDLASIEAGQVKIEVTSIHPAQVVEQSLQMAVSMAAKYDVEIDKATNVQDMPEIRVDAMRFKQVLLNLLSNAVKYNQSGGRVSLSCEQRENGMIRFSITDTGEGIPAEKHEHLFSPFDRLGRENLTVEGTGIGLALTRELVSLMDGQIGLESEVGKGSTFWVEFPISQTATVLENEPKAEQASASSQVDDVQLGNGDVNVLYVEDNPDNQELMEVIIEDIGGVQLHCTETAEEGLEIVEGLRPALILMDINLPGMSGLEALQVLQQKDTTSDIPVIAISARAMEDDVNAGLDAGFKAYLTKPFDVMELHAMISDELKP